MLTRPPLSILWIRFLIAGGLLFAGVFLAKLSVPRDLGTWLWLLLLGLLFGLLLGALLLKERLVPLDGLALLVIALGLWLVARGEG